MTKIFTTLNKERAFIKHRILKCNFKVQNSKKLHFEEKANFNYIISPLNYIISEKMIKLNFHSQK